MEEKNQDGPREGGLGPVKTETNAVTRGEGLCLHRGGIPCSPAKLSTRGAAQGASLSALGRTARPIGPGDAGAHLRKYFIAQPGSLPCPAENSLEQGSRLPSPVSSRPLSSQSELPSSELSCLQNCLMPVLPQPFYLSLTASELCHGLGFSIRFHSQQRFHLQQHKKCQNL